MKVSIAMATYNGHAYLYEQLKSLSDQSILPDELVVSDDCSDDDTVGILRDFARSADFPVRIVENAETIGHAKNFEKAISECVGDVICLSDQDDVWSTEKISCVLREFYNCPQALLVVHDAEIVKQNLEGTGLTKLGQVKSLGLSYSSFVMGCCTCFRRSILPVFLPIPVDYTHDAWLHAIAERLHGRRIILESMMRYRRHNSNASQGIGSNTVRMGRIDLARELMFENPRPWCEARLQKLSVLRSRMESATTEVRSMIGKSDIWIQAIASISAEAAAVEARLTTLGKRRVARLISVALMAARGQYQYFSGLRSLAKDILC